MGNLSNSKSKKLLIVFLTLLSIFFFFIAISRVDVSADEQATFGFEKGAWIKVIDEKELVNGGDVNAVRFKFFITKSYVQENEVQSLRVFATISDIPVLDKTFTDIESKVKNGTYVHNFDFANVPSNYYDKEILIKVTATLSNGENVTVSQSKSFEYVVCSALLYAHTEYNDFLFNYVGGDEIFSSTSELSVEADTSVEITLENYDGSPFRSIYVNSVLCSDTSLLTVSDNVNGLVIDVSQLESNKTHNIIAITQNGDIVHVSNLSVVANSSANEDIVYEEVFSSKKDESLDVLLNNEYEIESVNLDKTTSLEFTQTQNIICVYGLNEQVVGEHELELLVKNQNQKIIVPITLFDEIKEINSKRSFQGWLTECCQGEQYLYAKLTANVDLTDFVYNGGTNFEQSCTSGVFDGQGYSISNLNIYENGLFNKTKDFVIKNVGFINCKYTTNFLCVNEGESSTTSLINCYFDINELNGELCPFLNASYIDLIENVIFKINIYYSDENTCIFRNSDPKALKNTFVVGSNTKTQTPIKICSNLDIAKNCASYLTISDLILNANLESFNEFWDFTLTDKVWIN